MTSSIRTFSDRIWEPIRRFLEAMDGIDDAQGEYLFRLERRVRSLEAELEQLRNAPSQKAGSTTIL